MVNKCSAIGCKSLYNKSGNNVKLHRFPLTNKDTLPVWIAATGRENVWKPCKSSRLCGNHFQESEYIVGHGKGVLKSSAIPTIEYRIDLKKHSKKKCLNSHKRKLIKVEPMDNSYDIVQLNRNDGYTLIYEENMLLSDISRDSIHTQEYRKTKSSKATIKNCSSIETDECYDLEDTTHNKSAHHNNDENSIEEIRSEICNSKNQCYMFTNSFKEYEDITTDPYKFSSLESPRTNMNIDQITAHSNFNKIMALKLRRQRCTKNIYSLYFQSMTNKNVTRAKPMPFNDKTAKFGAFVEAQMNELLPNTNLYLKTKHKIQKLLMKAQLEMTH